MNACAVSSRPTASIGRLPTNATGFGLTAPDFGRSRIGSILLNAALCRAQAACLPNRNEGGDRKYAQVAPRRVSRRPDGRAVWAVRRLRAVDGRALGRPDCGADVPL